MPTTVQSVQKDDAFLRSSPYFAELDSESLKVVQRCVRHASFSKNEIIFIEGEPAPKLYFVKSGRVKLYKTSDEGKEQVLRVIKGGDSFNEVSVFDGGPAPVSAEALEPTTVYHMNRADIFSILERHPTIALATVKVLAERLRHLTSVIEDLSFRHVTSRLAKLLLQYADHRSAGTNSGLKERLTQQEMAAIIGTAREVVGRSLKALEKAGAIRIERHRIIICNTKLLEKMA